MNHSKWPLLALSLVAATMLAGNACAQMPAAIAAMGETVVATLHAEGAQVYECKAGAFHSAPYATDYVFLRKGS